MDKNSSGKILIADDEEKFLALIAEFLQSKGYECDCASNANIAVDMLQKREYDVFISDINMPGNLKLEFVKDIPSIVEGLPVILVTGHPSVNTAIKSLQLPVDAYFVKPFDFYKLLEQIVKSIVRYRSYRIVRMTHQRLHEWQRNLDNIAKLITEEKSKDSVPRIVNTFYTITVQNIIAALMDLKNLMEKLIIGSDEQYACNLLNCSRLNTLNNGLKASANILEKTRSSFKSKELEKLRKKIEGLVEEMKN